MLEKIPAIIFGTGAVSREAAYLIEEINAEAKAQSYDILGYIGETEEQIGQSIDGLPVLATDHQVAEIAKNWQKLALIIPMASPQIKRKIYEEVKDFPNCFFPNLIHPRVNLRNLKLGQGNIIQENTSISIGVCLGDFILINYGAFLGHDATIRSFCVINPQAKVCGNVVVEEECLLGVGSTILQNLRVGQGAIVGAGAVVTKEVQAESIVVGIPAKVVENRN